MFPVRGVPLRQLFERGCRKVPDGQRGVFNVVVVELLPDGVVVGSAVEADDVLDLLFLKEPDRIVGEVLVRVLEYVVWGGRTCESVGTRNVFCYPGKAVESSLLRCDSHDG